MAQTGLKSSDGNSSLLESISTYIKFICKTFEVRERRKFSFSALKMRVRLSIQTIFSPSLSPIMTFDSTKTIPH